MAIWHPTIDVEQFLFLGEDPQRPGLRLPSFADRLEEQTWPGVSGVGLWNLGKRGDPIQVLSCRDEVSAELAQIRIKTYEALSGTLQSITDGNIIFWHSVAVQLIDARIVTITTPAGAYLSATPPTHLVWATWQLRRTAAIP